MTIKYIKLKNGQDLVGEQKSFTDDGTHTFVKDIALVFVTPMKDTQNNQINLLPFAPFTEQNEITLREDDIMFMDTANKDLTEFFKDVTGRKQIITPDKSGLIL